ncbi:MAG TPA: LAGLIDADG family homing endonuclease [Candidatus Nanoarchaeia archaeon]|nr:LAGLIDADG family homing endonuclease [Candidatus Nanoarchaeia archaeon]
MEVKNKHWGQIKGGLNSRGSLKNINRPDKSKELAELVGILLGDGNIYSYSRGKKVGVYSARIAGDYKKDKEYHLDYVVPLCSKLFNTNMRIRHHSNNERFVCLDSKELVNFLVDIGLKSGDKIKNQVGIPLWIFENKEFLKACLRGLIDTDGSVYRMSKKDFKLIRMDFTNHNQALLNDAREAFIVLGFNPSKVIKGRKFYISRQNEIARYISEIGFSNPKHINRLSIFTAP